MRTDKVSNRKLELLRQCAGSNETTTEPIPLRDPVDGEPLDEARFWITVKRPGALGQDSLAAEESRTFTEEIVELNREDPSKTVVTRRSYTDTRDAPLLREAFKQGLVTAGVCPEIMSNDEIGEHKFSGDSDTDWEWISERPALLFRIVRSAVIEGIFSDLTKSVVDEGEVSVGQSEDNTDSPTSL
jgi:hypothetical protein